jgi:alcohol dehydrogenase
VRAVIADGLGKGWAVREVPDPSPGPADLLIAVEASGVCGSDIHLATRADYGGTFPRVPGHEFVGRVAEVGRDVRGWQPGDRAGVAWAQRWCGRCRMCSEQSYSFCAAGCDVTGGTVDGGHAELAVVDARAAIPLPVELEASQLAPVLCAGYTVYTALQDVAVAPGDRVAVIGVGGLGHLATQYARCLGGSVVAVTSNAGKRDELRGFGATDVVVARGEPAAEALRRAGGADVILVTGSGDPGQLSEAVRVGGRIALISPGDEPVAISARDAIFKRLRIVGSSPGPRDLLRQAIALHVDHGVRVATQVLPLEEAPRAFKLVSRGRARYRVVLVPNGPS